MKTLDNKVFMFKGKPVVDEQGEPINTHNAIIAVLEGSTYPSSREIIKAVKILGSLKVENDKINLEDEDFKFVNTWAGIYHPLTSRGLIFQDFYTQLENANGS